LGWSLSGPRPALGSGHHHQPASPPPVVAAYPTTFHAGDGDEDLRVTIAGSQFDRLEIFFHHNYLVERIVGLTNLHCYARVLLAPPSDNGTFVVWYGPCWDKFVAFGFMEKNKLVKVTNDPAQVTSPDVGLVATAPGYPARIEWVSTRLL